jgi:pyruvate formate-lyase activating enzyme-like uncharacterized protein
MCVLARARTHANTETKTYTQTQNTDIDRHTCTYLPKEALDLRKRVRQYVFRQLQKFSKLSDTAHTLSKLSYRAGF